MKRYNDPWLSDIPIKLLEETDDCIRSEVRRAEISARTRHDMKHLVRDALNDILEDDFVFDEILGKLLSEPKRQRINFPITLDQKESKIQADLKRIFNHGLGQLNSCHAICFAYSEVANQSVRVCRLFVDGNMWEISSNGTDGQEMEIEMVKIIATRTCITRESLVDLMKEPQGDTTIPPRILQLLTDLIQKSYLKVDLK
jgi:predicted secreted protein